MSVPVESTALFDTPKRFYRTSSLALKTLKPATHTAYGQALQCLHTFVDGKKLSFQQLNNALTQLASQMRSVPRTSTKAPSRRQLLTNTISALVHRIPALQHHLNFSRRSLRGWTRNGTPTQAWHLTRELVQAFVGDLIARGLPHLADAMVIQWAGLLRANELFQLKVNDVVLA